MNNAAVAREWRAVSLRQRYEQIRARALEDKGACSGMAMRWGMRSWIEADPQTEMPLITSGPKEQTGPLDHSWREMVVVWASVIVSQAERNYGGQQQA
jgi:hypothetical protein